MDTTPNTLSFPALDTLTPDTLVRAAEPGAEPFVPDGPIELLCLRVGGQEYGLPLPSIQEIRRYQTATPLPGQATAVLGVMELRGQVIALLDLRRLLNLPDIAKDDGLRAVVVLVRDGSLLGLVVDEVLDVLPTEPEQFRAFPTLPGPLTRRHLIGLVSAGERRVLRLRTDDWFAAHATQAA
ncbi:chemotaxis protein CheW [Roseateles sp.]|uniref:chemotaxis protein CheW n=1 Tax=Roseateles sp. TaxID=1971397 RepID=UPI0039EA06C9